MSSVLACGTFTEYLALLTQLLCNKFLIVQRNWYPIIVGVEDVCMIDIIAHTGFIPRVSCSVNVPQKSTFSPLVLIELTVPTQWEGYVLQTSLNSLFHIVKKLIFLPWFQVTMVILQTTKLYRLLW